MTKRQDEIFRDATRIAERRIRAGRRLQAEEVRQALWALGGAAVWALGRLRAGLAAGRRPAS